MTDKIEPTITIIDRPESLLLSWGRDAVSFGGLIGTAYALNERGLAVRTIIMEQGNG